MKFTSFSETAARHRWRRRWSEAFEYEKRTDGEIFNARLRTAWRVLRSHALCKGQLAPEERLAAIPEEQWLDPMPDASASNRTLTAQLIADDYAGLSLLPDSINFKKYTSAFFRTAKLLHISDYDLIGFDEHDYPLREEIIRFEYGYVHELIKEFTYGGHYHLRKELGDSGLSDAEIPSLIALVKAEATAHVDFDVDRDRRTMVLRLEDYIRRSQDAADLRSEMQGLKALSVVQGINKVEPQDTIQLVATIARDLASDERRRLLGSGGGGVEHTGSDTSEAI